MGRSEEWVRGVRNWSARAGSIGAAKRADLTAIKWADP
jgi:hypothetical protein